MSRESLLKEKKSAQPAESPRKNAMIVGIGELLWDVYPDGRKVAGGAPFNFAFHCHQLGHPAAIVSRVGDDDLGRELRDEVRRLGLSDEWIQTDRVHPTGTVKVTLDANKVPSYEICENVAWDYIEWNEELWRLTDICRAVCHGTLAQRGPVSLGTIDQFVSMSGGLIVCDLNLRHHYFDKELVRWSMGPSDWVKLNDSELAILAQLNAVPVDEIEQTVRRLCRPNQTMVVTRGGDGCVILIGDESFSEPAVPSRVVDTVGAGDAFTAAMVCLHLEGRPLRDCARFANHYAARVCEHQGATPKRSCAHTV